MVPSRRCSWDVDALPLRGLAAGGTSTPPQRCAVPCAAASIEAVHRSWAKYGRTRPSFLRLVHRRRAGSRPPLPASWECRHFRRADERTRSIADQRASHSEPIARMLLGVAGHPQHAQTREGQPLSNVLELGFAVAGRFRERFFALPAATS